jgi:DNA polymerase I-like protein with 3'-5' exonuclease and polymerase domains
MLMVAKKYRVVMTVHDAIAIVAPEEEAGQAQTYVEDCMRWLPSWADGLPLNCESGFGKTYGDC